MWRRAPSTITSSRARTCSTNCYRPWADLLDYIEARVDPTLSGAEREECRLRAWFAYQDENPEFLRILNEAEIFAPRAYWAHIDNIADGYMRSLKRGRARGEIAALDDEALHAIATVLLAARAYLGQERTRGRGRSAPVPEAVIRGYMALLRNGLFTEPCSKANVNDLNPESPTTLR